MGLFDFINCEKILPEIPEDFLRYWKVKVENINFQTKDTPCQFMAHYKIDADGNLLVQRMEPSDDDHIWDPEANFSGIINFYESYCHPEHACDNKGSNDRFEYGWVEYEGLFKNGTLIGDIELVKIERPVELTDKELEEKRNKIKKVRRQAQARLKKSRKENPTPPQQLIDNIDKELMLVETIMDETDIIQALNNIKTLVKTYRQKYDQWY